MVSFLKNLYNDSYMKLKPLHKKDTRILIVDDSSTMRKIIGSWLNINGFTQMDEASDGKEALRKLTSQTPIPFDLILCDWNMPYLNGLELLVKFREKEASNIIPFIMVTCEVDQSQVELALNSGANNYLAKPFTKQTLTEKINYTLNKYYEFKND